MESHDATQLLPASSRISTGGYRLACIEQIHYTSTNSGPSPDPEARPRSISQSKYPAVSKLQRLVCRVSRDSTNCQDRISIEG